MSSYTHKTPFLFPMAIWSTWMVQNKTAMENQTFNPPIIIKGIKSLATELFFSLPFQLKRSKYNNILIGWKPPLAGFFKLNTDGSARSRKSR